jgi:Flp pilus assembly protein TadD
VPAHNDLGISLQGCRQIAEAEPCYRRAVELAPRFAEAMSNLGALLPSGIGAIRSNRAAW